MTHISDSAPVISVIIPVYNTRKYLPNTLKNIVEDQFSTLQPQQWELIVVDDGSTDGSHLEVEPWIARFPESVKLIRTPNQGVSTARNTGLAAACGRYVYFADSDDLILCRALPELLQLSEASDPDVIKFLFKHISTEEYGRLAGNVPQAELGSDDVSVYTIGEFMEETYGLSRPMIQTSTCQTIYKRSLLIDHNLGFDPTLTVGEDEALTWNAMLHVHTVAYTPAKLFLYHQRAGSISHADNSEREERYQFNRIEFCGKMISILGRVKDAGMMTPEIWRNTSRNYMFGYYHSIIDLIVKGFPLSTIYRAMKLYRSYGGDVHPGRPRFTPFYDTAEMPASVKRRRLLVAYGLGTLIKLGL